MIPALRGAFGHLRERLLHPSSPAREPRKTAAESPIPLPAIAPADSTARLGIAPPPPVALDRRAGRDLPEIGRMRLEALPPILEVPPQRPEERTVEGGRAEPRGDAQRVGSALPRPAPEQRPAPNLARLVTPLFDLMTDTSVPWARELPGRMLEKAHEVVGDCGGRLDRSLRSASAEPPDGALLAALHDRGSRIGDSHAHALAALALLLDGAPPKLLAAVADAFALSVQLAVQCDRAEGQLGQASQALSYSHRLAARVRGRLLGLPAGKSFLLPAAVDANPVFVRFERRDRQNVVLSIHGGRDALRVYLFSARNLRGRRGAEPAVLDAIATLLAGVALPAQSIDAAALEAKLDAAFTPARWHAEGPSRPRSAFEALLSFLETEAPRLHRQLVI